MATVSLNGINLTLTNITAIRMTEIINVDGTVSRAVRFFADGNENTGFHICQIIAEADAADPENIKVPIEDFEV